MIGQGNPQEYIDEIKAPSILQQRKGRITTQLSPDGTLRIWDGNNHKVSKGTPPIGEQLSTLKYYEEKRNVAD